MIDATLERALDEVAGYLELGMPEVAAGTLDELPKKLQSHPEVLAARFAVLNAAKRWSEAAPIARRLTDFMDEEPQHWIWWAFATRRAESVEAGGDPGRCGRAPSGYCDHPLQARLLRGGQRSARTRCRQRPSTRRTRPSRSGAR